MKRLLTAVNRLAADVRSDRELLTSFATNRDPGAMAELFRRHAGVIRATAADVCPAAADEVVQAVFLLLADRAGSLALRETAAGWLFLAARRLALKARTAAARRARHEAHAPPPAPASDALDDLAFREVRALVAEELAELPEQLRVPLLLHYWEGVTHAQAAARLGCPVNTVKRRLEAGRERLGTRLARRGLTGTGVLTALTAVQARAKARSPLDLRPNGPVAEAPAAVLPGGLALGPGRLGIGTLVGTAAYVLAVGLGLSFALGSPPGATSDPVNQPPAPASAARGPVTDGGRD
jgi:RNA polymerase sigma factor (sigma-70 family)